MKVIRNILIILLLMATGIFISQNLRLGMPISETTNSTILQELKRLQNLVTIEHTFQSIVSFKQHTPFPMTDSALPGTTSKFLLHYTGHVQAGVNLSSLQIQDTPAELVLVLPPAQVLSTTADFDTVQVYDQQEGVFADVRLEDQNHAIATDLRRVKNELIYQGLLQEGQDHAYEILRNQATHMTHKLVRIETP